MIICLIFVFQLFLENTIRKFEGAWKDQNGVKFRLWQKTNNRLYYTFARDGAFENFYGDDYDDEDCIINWDGGNKLNSVGIYDGDKIITWPNGRWVKQGNQCPIIIVSYVESTYKQNCYKIFIYHDISKSI